MHGKVLWEFRAVVAILFGFFLKGFDNDGNLKNAERKFHERFV